MRNDYLTKSLPPKSSPGANSHGAETNAEWLIREGEGFLRRGKDVVIARASTGTQALCFRRDIFEGDEVVWPEQDGETVSAKP